MPHTVSAVARHTACMAVSAGRRLRLDLGKALARASTDTNRKLVWSEADVDMLRRIETTADRAVLLRQRFAELDAAGEFGVAVRVSSEIRLCDRLVTELVARIEAGLRPKVVSELHRRSAQARWSRGEVLS